MKQSVQMYGFLWLISLGLLMLTQLTGLVIQFKEVSEISAHAIELIEVHDGLDENCMVALEKLQALYPKLILSFEEKDYDLSYYYVILSGSYNFEIPILNLKIPITTTKQTRRLNK